jgi:hypothetical protein
MGVLFEAAGMIHMLQVLAAVSLSTFLDNDR